MVADMKINNKRFVLFLFFLSWLVYFISYIGRLNYSAAMTLMMKESILSKSQAGFISMLYFGLYGMGQLCNGILGDRINPKKMIFLGLFISAIANLAMGVRHIFLIYAVIWGINGYAQSMIWPPILRIFSEKLNEKEKLKACVDIVSSQVGGTFMAYLISSLVIWLWGWRAVFFAASVLLFFVSLFWLWGFKKIERISPMPDNRNKGSRVKNIPQKESNIILLIFHYGLPAAFFPVLVHGILKDGITTWIPTYISESFFTSPSFSVLITACIPIINLSGAYLAKYIYKKSRNNEFCSASYFFAISGIALLGIYLARGRCLFLTILFFSLTTLSMMGVNTLFVNILPLKFERINKVSTVSGFFNAIAYGGCAISTYGIGLFVEKSGWALTITSWFALTALAFFLCLIFRKKELTSIGSI